MQTPIAFQVDVRSATPIYEQIVRQVRYATAAGTVSRGQALPSVRQLAVHLRVNPNTVARAYRDLEAEGIVETRRGQGTFVAGVGRRLSVAQRRQLLAPSADRFVAEAMALGFDRKELAGLIEASWSRLEAGGPERREKAPGGGASSHPVRKTSGEGDV